MQIAKTSRILSKDSTKIGALALDYRDRIISVGVNGYPPGYDDEDLSDKYDKVIHAEVNAILNSQAKSGEIKTIIIYGLPPCSECLKFLIAYGVKDVYYSVDKNIASHEKWCTIYDNSVQLHCKHINIKEIDCD